MIKLGVALLAAASFAVPAAATITVQTRSVSLATLDDAALDTTLAFNNFNFYGLAGEHLTQVGIVVIANVNGRVTATNGATGGTAASRKRNVSASYALTTSVSGNGLSISGTQPASQTRAGVAGNGTSVTLNQLNPSLTLGDTLFSGFDSFVAGAVRFALQASALFTSVPASNVAYGSPSITGGRASVELTYTSAVPEPASWALMVIGFGMIGVARRARRLVLAA